MATFTRDGYGIVEPNHLSAQRTGQIYAQLPANSDIEVLENGQFVKYDYVNNEVNFTGSGEWMMVFNEIKLYEPRQFLKDFAMKAADAVDGEIVPRVFKINSGDIFTTNCVGAPGAAVTVSAGDKLSVGSDGYLAVDASGDFEVVAITTCPDAVQTAVKVKKI